MRCPRCGNENPGDNRFCGMCGATLLEPQPAVTQTQRIAAPNAPSAAASTTAPRPRQTEPLPATPAPAPERPAAINGPSFLGLNDPPPASRKGSGLSIDPHSTSRSVDYLLDDEEEPRGSGAGKGFLILIALLLAAGFGYLRWKGQPIPFLGSGSDKPSANTTSPTPSDSTSPTSPSGTPSSSITPEPTPSSPAPSTDGNAAPPNSPAGTANSPGSAGSPAAAASDDSKTDSPSPAAKADNPAPVPKKSAPDSSDATDSADADQPAAKPSAAPRPRPVDTVAEAHRYLYGQGARQDCDRGMRLLKPAANAGNVKAMAEMGALYSAGLCTPHDLPSAYRWFAVALRKDPGNEAIQSDLQKLWGEMTQPERQLAIKLTQ